MSSAPIIMSMVSGAGNAASSYEAGQSNKAISRFNAANSRIQAEQALESGATQEARAGIKEGILRGEQTSAFAGQGVLANAGTARSVIAGSEAVSEMDKLMIGVYARRQAYGYKVQAAGETFAGKQAARAGNEAAIAGLLRTGGSVMEKSNANNPTSGEKDYSKMDLKSLLAEEGNTGGEMRSTSPGNMRF